MRLVALALLLSAAACTASPIVDGAAYPRASPEKRVTGDVPSTPATRRPGCGVVDPAGKEYGADLRPRRVQAGETVRVFGTTYRGEDGRWASSRKIEVWWNYRRQHGVGGPDKLLIGTIRPGRRCRFELDVTIPDAAPGNYPVVALVHSAEGYGFFGWWRVRVEP